MSNPTFKKNRKKKPRYVTTKTRWRFGDKYFRGAKNFVQYALKVLGKSRSKKQREVFEKILGSRSMARAAEGKSPNWSGAARQLVANLPEVCTRSTLTRTKPTRARVYTGKEIEEKYFGKGKGRGLTAYKEKRVTQKSLNSGKR